jgi:lipoate-protein ligase A
MSHPVWFDLTLPSPAENLACDEALLDAGEASGIPGVLRFWESSEYFVVVGYGNNAAVEVNLPACREAAVPVLRRCSGGGTVLQGPGCLNYALVLPLSADPALTTVTGANHYVLERHRRALQELLGREVRVQGYTDLTLGDLKFSGNAQRRRRRTALVHGTFLLDFDFTRIEQLLPPPSRAPDYRGGRTHARFVAGLDVSRAALRECLCRAWEATAHPLELPQDAIRRLVQDVYSRDEYNLRVQP